MMRRYLGLIALLYVFVAPSIYGQVYKITDLGTLGGDSYPSDINALGQVAGYSTLKASPGWHAFFWTRTGGMQDLGTLGGTTSIAYGLNNFGQVVGEADTTAAAAFHAFLWTQAGGMQDLGTLGGNDSGAQSINDLGQVVGWSDTIPATELSERAFLWTKTAGSQNLGTLGGDFSIAYDINGLSQVVGSSTITIGAATQPAFLWSQTGGMQNLGTLGFASTPWRINNRGEFVGSYSAIGVVGHAFIWTAATGYLDLGTLGGNISSATGINDCGQVVGTSRLADNVTLRAFLWTPGGGSSGPKPIPSLEFALDSCGCRGH